MSWKKAIYSAHRWMGLLVSAQLLAWSVGGFMFSILDIDNVHGDWDRNIAMTPPLRIERVNVMPSDAVVAAVRAGFDRSQITAARIRERMGRIVYELFDSEQRPLVAVDAESGEVISRISQQQAREIALADFKPSATVETVSLLEDEAPLEYRGSPMPVYQVVLTHPKKPHLYISPVTGEVVSRRNKPWRTFDFFWMLHIMDYSQREDFNHWLLSAMSVLAIMTSMTGLAMWMLRLRWLRRRAAVSR